MSLDFVFHKPGFRLAGSALLAGLLGWSALSFAQAAAPPQTTVPDAQIEANVLRAFAGAPDLANQTISTTTVYGVVTLSGSVQTEALRTQAENLAARSMGVQKVVDELVLSDEAGNAQPAGSQGGEPQQSDATMAPAQTSSDDGSQHAPSPDVYAQQHGYDQQQPDDAQQNPYPQQPQSNYPQQQPYPGQTYGDQQAGQSVVIPSGAMVRIRINQMLDSGRTRPGTPFDGVVVNDVVADNAIAIPRGAIVRGTVVDAKKSGALAGRGELSLQLTDVTLGGRSYPLVSNIWSRNGDDKTSETVGKTALGGGMGALIGGAAGGGAGAAIGAGIGGLLGLSSAASSHRGQVYVPSEGLLSFQLAQPATVTTVSQREMDRLAQGVPFGAQSRRRMYPNPGYGPAYPPPPSPY